MGNNENVVINDYILLSGELPGVCNYKPHPLILSLAEELNRTVGAGISIGPNQVPKSPGFGRFFREAGVLLAAVRIGTDFWPADADVVISHELIHLALKARGYPNYHWKTEKSGYLGIPLNSAFEHPLIIKEQRENGINSASLARRDVEHHAKHIFAVKGKIERVERDCMKKTAIMWADRSFWNTDIQMIKKIIKLIKVHPDHHIFSVVRGHISQFLADPTPESLKLHLDACASSLSLSADSYWLEYLSHA